MRRLTEAGSLHLDGLWRRVLAGGEAAHHTPAAHEEGEDRGGDETAGATGLPGAAGRSVLHGEDSSCV
ncbi:hypothetical protein GCM10027451_42990 [Geodermatophilus aquaeductus]